MLQIAVNQTEFYDELRNEFVTVKAQTLQLEHSLVSISKWESKWKKAFLDPSQKKTSEEVLDYIRCMTLTQNVNPLVYQALSSSNIKTIMDYMDDPMSATVINEIKIPGERPRRKEVVTSELIYYWMVALQIPFECQKWHFNRLMNLIRICNIKNSPPKKMGKREILNRNNALNAARRASLGTKG